MKKIVVISSGFIGEYLIKRLQSLKHEVTVFHHNDEIKIDQADYIFYLSSYGNHFHQKDNKQIIKANVLDYLELLRQTKDIQYQGLFYFSTSSVSLPVQTTYSDTKYIAEILGKRFYRKYNKPIVAIRPSSIYGIGEASFRFIPVAISYLGSKKKMPFTNGSHDWLWVEDFVDGVIKVMENSISLAGKSVSIGSGQQYTNKQVIEKLEKISGKKIQLLESDLVKRPYDTNNWVTDISRMSALGWIPKTSLDTGLTKLYEYFRKKDS